MFLQKSENDHAVFGLLYIQRGEILDFSPSLDEEATKLKMFTINNHMKAESEDQDFLNFEENYDGFIRTTIA